jgi:predicted ester cyclase
VAARWTITGTHTGEWNGLAPTGTTIQYSGMTLFRLAGGKIVETWNH